MPVYFPSCQTRIVTYQHTLPHLQKAGIWYTDGNPAWPKTQPRGMNEIKVLIVQLLQDIVEALLIPGLECLRREILGFLLDRMSIIPKISIKSQKDLTVFNYFLITYENQCFLL